MKVFAGVLNIIKDSGRVLQASYNGKPKNNIRNLNSYGFWSNPPKGSKVVLIQDINGNYYGVAYLDNVIPELKEGETIIGNFSLSSFIKFSETGKVSISNSTTDLLTLLTELKTILKTGKLANDITIVFGSDTQTLIDTWFTNLQELLE